MFVEFLFDVLLMFFSDVLYFEGVLIVCCGDVWVLFRDDLFVCVFFVRILCVEVGVFGCVLLLCGFIIECYGSV